MDDVNHAVLLEAIKNNTAKYRLIWESYKNDGFSQGGRNHGYKDVESLDKVEEEIVSGFHTGWSVFVEAFVTEPRPIRDTVIKSEYVSDGTQGKIVSHLTLPMWDKSLTRP